MKVKCPTCKCETEYSAENRFRPFCSERCRLIDLGQWAEEKYAIPVQNQPTEEELIDVDELHELGEDA
mgnify:CR=1 FL=1